LLIWERDIKYLRHLVHWPSILLAIVIVVPWYVAIWQATNGQFFTDAIGQDLAPKLAGKSENPGIPPGAHLLISPIIMWPGSFLIPAAIWAGWSLRKDPRVRLLVAWVIPGWLMFEAAPAKLAHYTLPVHGAIVLLGAIGLLAGAWQRGWVKWVGLGLFVLGSLVLIAAPLALANDIAPSYGQQALIISVGIGIATLIALILTIRRSKFAGFGFAGLAIATSIGLKGYLVPRIAELNVSGRVSEVLEYANLHPRLSEGKPGPLIGFGYQEPSLIFLTRSDSALSSIAAATHAARLGSGVVIARESLGALNQSLMGRGLKVEQIEEMSVTGTNYSKGDPVDLLIGKVVGLPATSAPQ
jgi:4-amino-4-deoxy-L-arabinose transferase-like glycosyltransferase